MIFAGYKDKDARTGRSGSVDQLHVVLWILDWAFYGILFWLRFGVNIGLWYEVDDDLMFIQSLFYLYNGYGPDSEDAA